jgi:hypothetical protein
MKLAIRSIPVRPIHIVLTILLVAGVITSGRNLASADEWGAWKESGSSECLEAGTNIVTTDSPNLHNIAVINSCATNYTVKVEEDHYDEGGHMLNQCIEGYSTNYAQCSLQDSTGSGDFWGWAVWINIGGTIYHFACTGVSSNYYECYHTD